MLRLFHFFRQFEKQLMIADKLKHIILASAIRNLSQFIPFVLSMLFSFWLKFQTYSASYIPSYVVSWIMATSPTNVKQKITNSSISLSIDFLFFFLPKMKWIEKRCSWKFVNFIEIISSSIKTTTDFFF